MSLRLALKRFICWLGFGSLLIEFCESCGARVDQVWHATDLLWIQVTGTAEGVRCIRCFDAESERRGKMLRWEPLVSRVRFEGEWLPTNAVQPKDAAE